MAPKQTTACFYCKSPLDPDVPFCPSCRYKDRNRFIPNYDPDTPKSPLGAALLIALIRVVGLLLLVRLLGDQFDRDGSRTRFAAPNRALAPSLVQRMHDPTNLLLDPEGRAKDSTTSAVP